MNKEIALKPYAHKIFYRDEIFRLNNGHNAFFGLQEYLANKKITIHTVDLARKPKLYFYADMPYPWEFKNWINILTNRSSRHVLFVLESPLINPFNQYNLLRRFFTKTYSWNTMFSGTQQQTMKIPQLDSTKTKETPFSKKRFLVLINANKTIPMLLRIFSLGISDLYKKRLESIRAMERLLPFDFDLYGKGWNNYSSNKGEIEMGKKNSVLSKYKYCLCFENTQAPGYITEKIFDCLKSSVIPIYLGAPDIDSYVPKECFIDYRQFNSYTELVSFLQSISEKDYNLQLKKINLFLRSKKYELWSQQHFFKLIGKESLYV